ncbi:ribosome-binding protein aMBF1 (putative translation factor) [Deinococcus metalli]|uniref:Ribosome-binding protein aMBF1 (Putative translation factor) n=1 Tax=Deinococcus metalli TaxID=1141878 RepID=A0A7W8KJF7_9DEIO|nr:helix-turn-helix transcriptional regulator [Deinococcus metalli]MBB5379262.1 ribosome-binding protein aMBF1 (putative translation factor) [Deinococcus metalli]GHF66014.1 hypothetical protein GCM10017781_47180 [Deinococcus metalli]
MSNPAPSIRQRLADNVRRLRQEREWSQEDLAAHASLHHNQISVIERARSGTGIDIVEKLALAFGVRAGELID